MALDTSSKQAIALPSSRGVKRRARILAAFHDCIISKGYAKSTLRDVAREAGMTASHLLYYFSGKDTFSPARALPALK
jgi:AcrR family transcriptional regulator